MIYVIAFVVIIPIIEYVVNQNSKQNFQQEQTTKHRDKYIQPFTNTINIQSGDKSIETDVKISETDTSIRNELNGKTFDLDKKVLFGNECKDVWLNSNNSDTQRAKNILIAWYIYKYKNLFTDWCSPANMTNYLHNFDTKFGKYYKNSIDYLGAKTEKCIMEPMAKSRKTYEFQEFDTLYSEANQYSDIKYISKMDFCETINSDKNIQNTFFELFQDDIQKIKKLEFSTTVTTK